MSMEFDDDLVTPEMVQIALEIYFGKGGAKIARHDDGDTLMRNALRAAIKVGGLVKSQEKLGKYKCAHQHDYNQNDTSPCSHGCHNEHC